MSVNLEEKIKKENEQLQKSESLLEKTVKKAMNFGRKPKNTQKKTAPKTSRQEMPEEKEAAIPKETVKKESSKEESKKKSQPAKRSSNAKKAAGQKTKDQAAPKQTAAKKNACKISADGGENKIYRQVPDRNPNEKKHLKRRAPSAGADHIFGRSGRNRQKRYSL